MDLEKLEEASRLKEDIVYYKRNQENINRLNSNKLNVAEIEINYLDKKYDSYRFTLLESLFSCEREELKEERKIYCEIFEELIDYIITNISPRFESAINKLENKLKEL